MKKTITILVIILLFLPLINAQVDPVANVGSAYSWLRTQTPISVSEAALTVMALKQVSHSDAQPFIDWIKTKEDPLGCFPMGACKLKDTSLALMVLDKEGLSVTAGIDWLISQMAPNTDGDIFLQIITSSTGTCSVEYTTQGIPKTAILDVDQGQISSQNCKTPTTFFNLGDCLEQTPNFFVKNPSITMSISCRELGSAGLTLNYVEGSAYYIMESTSSNELRSYRINNGYFNNYEDSLYASWTLQELGSDVNAVTWLKKDFSTGNVLDNALLYIITDEGFYLPNLASLQDQNTGSFGEVYETGLAAYSFAKSGYYADEVTIARRWLDSRQAQSGSWNNDVSETAMALIGAYSDESVSLQPCEPGKCFMPSGIPSYGCGDNICDYDETEESCPEDCGEPSAICQINGICEPEYGEDYLNCPEDCPAPTEYLCGDGFCDEGEETTCPEDCGEITPTAICGDDFCDYDETEETCPQDCKKSSFIKWLIFILVLILFLAAAYYFLILKKGKELFKFKKKPPKRPFKPTKLPPTRAQQYRIPIKRKPARKSYIEDELTRSIKEAKKLLKK